MEPQSTGSMLESMEIQYPSIDLWKDNKLINIRINIITEQEGFNKLLDAILLRKASSFQVLDHSLEDTN